MTETPDRLDEPNTGSVAPLAPAPALDSHRPHRLFQVAAWVAIVAGTLFVVATIFFTGFFMGRHSGQGHWGGHHQRGREAVYHWPKGGPPWPVPAPGSPGMGPGGPNAVQGGPGPGAAGPSPSSPPSRP